jgi:hypothetical protein
MLIIARYMSSVWLDEKYTIFFLGELSPVRLKGNQTP